jgi:hypothetical protein
MTYAIVQTIDENINIESVLATKDECNQYINDLTHLLIDDVKRVIQGIIHSKDKINMDGIYIEETEDMTRFNIIQRNTELDPGWISNGVSQNCTKLGNIQIKPLPATNNKNNDHTNDNCARNDYSSNDYVVIDNKHKKITNGIRQFTPELTAEFMTKLTERNTKQTPFILKHKNE